jgi:formate dehydrogenase subunit beta
VKQFEDALRREARRLLAEKKIDVLVGYEAGTMPLQSTPCFITSPNEADRLIWDATCTHNLATFVHGIIFRHRESQKRRKPQERTRRVVGVVARGCTTRAIIVHLQENQYAREDVVILGMPCSGVLDLHKVKRKLEFHDILEGSLEGEAVRLRTADGEQELALREYLADSCLSCSQNNPVIADVALGEIALNIDRKAEFKRVEEFSALSREERWAYLETEMGRCTRCNACRQACPMCYCRECFAEQTKPQWFGITEAMPDTIGFHIIRTFHMAGRCVDCGACTAACPMGIDLRTFLKKLEKDCLEMYEYKAGMDMEKRPPLSDYSVNDPQAFITEP